MTRTLLALILLLVAACTTVPGTGRSQLNFMSTTDEMRLGTQAYREMLAEEQVVTSGADYRMVQRIGRRIAYAAQDLYPDSAATEFEWEFTLIDAPDTANAWALPGGKCAVYTGLLPITQDEDSLAMVMGHEVAHAIAHHGAERMSQGMVIQGALVGAELSMADMDADQRSNIMLALGVGANVGVMLPFSRSHESEADEIGLYLAAHAGYNPQTAIGLWERMGAAGGAGPPEFLSTHPSEDTRIERLKEHMPEAMELYRAALERGDRR